ncbi:unnamed protein product [Closterium sp. Naga37s-1]|nr:unnamed protein product [Closterium sp. Naga37s-1]
MSDSAQPAATAAFQPAAAYAFQAAATYAFQPAATTAFQPAATTAFQPAATTAFQPAAASAFQPAATAAVERAETPAFQPAATAAYQPAAASAFLPAATTAFQPAATTAFQPAAASTFQPAATAAFQPDPATAAIQPAATAAFQPAATTAFQPAAASAFQPAATAAFQPDPATAAFQPAATAAFQPAATAAFQPAATTAFQPAAASAFQPAATAAFQPDPATAAFQPAATAAFQPAATAAFQPAATAAFRSAAGDTFYEDGDEGTGYEQPVDLEEQPEVEPQIPEPEYSDELFGGGATDRTTAAVNPVDRAAFEEQAARTRDLERQLLQAQNAMRGLERQLAASQHANGTRDSQQAPATPNNPANAPGGEPAAAVHTDHGGVSAGVAAADDIPDATLNMACMTIMVEPNRPAIIDAVNTAYKSQAILNLRHLTRMQRTWAHQYATALAAVPGKHNGFYPHPAPPPSFPYPSPISPLNVTPSPSPLPHIAPPLALPSQPLPHKAAATKAVEIIVYETPNAHLQFWIPRTVVINALAKALRYTDPAQIENLTLVMDNESDRPSHFTKKFQDKRNKILTIGTGRVGVRGGAFSCWPARISLPRIDSPSLSPAFSPSTSLLACLPPQHRHRPRRSTGRVGVRGGAFSCWPARISLPRIDSPSLSPAFSPSASFLACLPPQHRHRPRRSTGRVGVRGGAFSCWPARISLPRIDSPSLSPAFSPSASLLACLPPQHRHRPRRSTGRVGVRGGAFSCWPARISLPRIDSPSLSPAFSPSASLLACLPPQHRHRPRRSTGRVGVRGGAFSCWPARISLPRIDSPSLSPAFSPSASLLACLPPQHRHRPRRSRVGVRGGAFSCWPARISLPRIDSPSLSPAFSPSASLLACLPPQHRHRPRRSRVGVRGGAFSCWPARISLHRIDSPSLSPAFSPSASLLACLPPQHRHRPRRSTGRVGVRGGAFSCWPARISLPRIDSPSLSPAFSPSASLLACLPPQHRHRPRRSTGRVGVRGGAFSCWPARISLPRIDPPSLSPAFSPSASLLACLPPQHRHRPRRSTGRVGVRGGAFSCWPARISLPRIDSPSLSPAFSPSASLLACLPPQHRHRPRRSTGRVGVRGGAFSCWPARISLPRIDSPSLSPAFSPSASLLACLPPQHRHRPRRSRVGVRGGAFSCWPARISLPRIDSPSLSPAFSPSASLLACLPPQHRHRPRRSRVGVRGGAFSCWPARISLHRIDSPSLSPAFSPSASLLACLPPQHRHRPRRSTGRVGVRGGAFSCWPARISLPRIDSPSLSPAFSPSASLLACLPPQHRHRPRRSTGRVGVRGGAFSCWPARISLPRIDPPSLSPAFSPSASLLACLPPQHRHRPRRSRVGVRGGAFSCWPARISLHRIDSPSLSPAFSPSASLLACLPPQHRHRPRRSTGRVGVRGGAFSCWPARISLPRIDSPSLSPAFSPSASLLACLPPQHRHRPRRSTGRVGVRGGAFSCWPARISLPRIDPPSLSPAFSPSASLLACLPPQHRHRPRRSTGRVGVRGGAFSCWPARISLPRIDSPSLSPAFSPSASFLACLPPQHRHRPRRSTGRVGVRGGAFSCWPARISLPRIDSPSLSPAFSPSASLLACLPPQHRHRPRRSTGRVGVRGGAFSCWPARISLPRIDSPSLSPAFSPSASLLACLPPQHRHRPRRSRVGVRGGAFSCWPARISLPRIDSPSLSPAFSPSASFLACLPPQHRHRPRRSTGRVGVRGGAFSCWPARISLPRIDSPSLSPAFSPSASLLACLPPQHRHRPRRSTGRVGVRGGAFSCWPARISLPRIDPPSLSPAFSPSASLLACLPPQHRHRPRRSLVGVRGGAFSCWPARISLPRIDPPSLSPAFSPSASLLACLPPQHRHRPRRSRVGVRGGAFSCWPARISLHRIDSPSLSPAFSPSASLLACLPPQHRHRPRRSTGRVGVRGGAFSCWPARISLPRIDSPSLSPAFSPSASLLACLPPQHRHRPRRSTGRVGVRGGAFSCWPARISLPRIDSPSLSPAFSPSASLLACLPPQHRHRPRRSTGRVGVRGGAFSCWPARISLPRIDSPSLSPAFSPSASLLACLPPQHSIGTGRVGVRGGAFSCWPARISLPRIDSPSLSPAFSPSASLLACLPPQHRHRPRRSRVGVRGGAFSCWPARISLPRIDSPSLSPAFSPSASLLACLPPQHSIRTGRVEVRGGAFSCWPARISQPRIDSPSLSPAFSPSASLLACLPPPHRHGPRRCERRGLRASHWIALTPPLLSPAFSPSASLLACLPPQPTPSLPPPVAHAFSECHPRFPIPSLAVFPSLHPRFPIPSRRRFPFPSPALIVLVAWLPKTVAHNSPARLPRNLPSIPSLPPFSSFYPSPAPLFYSDPSVFHLSLPRHSSVSALPISPRFALSPPSFSPCPSLRFPPCFSLPFPLSFHPFPPLFLSPYPRVFPSVSLLVLRSLSPVSFPPFTPLFLPPLPPCPSLRLPSVFLPPLPPCPSLRLGPCPSVPFPLSFPPSWPLSFRPFPPVLPSVLALVLPSLSPCPSLRHGPCPSVPFPLSFPPSWPLSFRPFPPVLPSVLALVLPSLSPCPSPRLGPCPSVPFPLSFPPSWPLSFRPFPPVLPSVYPPCSSLPFIVSFHPSPHLSLPPFPNGPSLRFPPSPSLPFPHVLPSVSPIVPPSLSPMSFHPCRPLSLTPFPSCPSLRFPSCPSLPFPHVLPSVSL